MKAGQAAGTDRNNKRVDANTLQSPVVILTTISLALAIVAMIYAFLCWRQRNMKYFAFLTIAIAVNVLGYFLEVTSPTLEAAIVSCKVAYLGVPFTGLLFFLFSLDYSDETFPGRWFMPTAFLIGILFTVAVFLYPWVPIFYEDLAFSTAGLVNHLIVTPGPLYYPCIIFSSLFTILAFINLALCFVREKHYQGTVIFVIAVFLPLFAQFYTMIFGLIDGWNPQRTALAFSVILLAIYLARYKQARWQSVGRELVVQEMEDGFILLNNKLTVIDHNKSAERYFPLLGQMKRTIKVAEIWPLDSAMYQEYGTHQTEMLHNAETIHLKITTSPLEAEGEVTGTLIILNDDTMNTRMMQELTRMAKTDELTGLNNRATFFHDATISFELAKREARTSGCALMIDIDYFKNVNDTYGHAVGDTVLRFIGELLLRRLRHTDICGRYGGEELAVWMPATALEGAVKVAEELRELTESHVFKHDDVAFNVTISIGVACMHQLKPKNFDEIIQKADYALYEAKKTGRNRVCVYKG